MGLHFVFLCSLQCAQENCLVYRSYEMVYCPSLYQLDADYLKEAQNLSIKLPQEALSNHCCEDKARLDDGCFKLIDERLDSPFCPDLD
jgi:hypothetical protein